MGIGDWVLGIGDWRLGIRKTLPCLPSPYFLVPNAHSIDY